MLKVNNKTLISMIGSIAVSSLLTLSVAQAQEGPRALGGESEERLANSFARLDTSGDEVIDSSEWLDHKLAKAEKLFTRKDADEDGFLTFEEATTTRRGEVRDLSDIADDIVQCVSDLKDETGDDNIVVPSADSFLSPEDKFANADSNGDGVLDLDEVLASATTKANDGFSNMDTDGDGFVTFEEYSSAAESRSATRRAIKSCIDELTDEEIV